jgi:hypothetical protein
MIALGLVGVSWAKEADYHCIYPFSSRQAFVLSFAKRRRNGRFFGFEKGVELASRPVSWRGEMTSSHRVYSHGKQK